MGGLIDGNLRRKIKTMSLRNLELLTYEVRDFLISRVSRTGGHLASNLGVVELTVALHRVFDVDRDRIVWDVGHQVYVHKILTGRAEGFAGLRQYGGLSGFPKTGEDAADVFNTGHGSTSISAAMGLAEARDIRGEGHHVVAVIGDGALTGGLAYEGLNNAGNRQTRMVVVLNDNEMSISESTGSVAQYLSKLRTSPAYRSAKNVLRERMARIPRVGEKVVQGAERMRNLMRYATVPGTLFEELGFSYYGPVDGHNLGELIELFEAVKHMDGPVLVHILTKKGKGYLNAERNPGRFHRVGAFDPETGAALEKKRRSWSVVAGEAMMALAERDPRVVCISAAMTKAVGLSKFAESYYNHFFDVGMAEGHAVTFAAGLAAGGLRPFVFAYSTFLQRSYDQILLDVCAQGLPVVFMVDRAGNVGRDGETHHGVFDLSYLRHMPGLVVMAPKDGAELAAMAGFAMEHGGPVAIRYPRGEAPEGGGDMVASQCAVPSGSVPIVLGRSERVIDGGGGEDVTIFAIGKMVGIAAEAAQVLEAGGGDASQGGADIRVGVVNMRFVSPIDEDAVLKAARQGAAIVTLEDNVLKGGVGEGVCALLAREGLSAPVLCIGWPDGFVPHGGVSELMGLYGLDAAGVAEKVRGFVGEGAD